MRQMVQCPNRGRAYYKWVNAIRCRMTDRELHDKRQIEDREQKREANRSNMEPAARDWRG